MSFLYVNRATLQPRYFQNTPASLLKWTGGFYMIDGFLQHLKDTRYDSEQHSEKTIPCAKYSPLTHQEEKRLQEPKTRFSAGLSHLSSGFQKLRCTWITPSPCPKMHVQVLNARFYFSKCTFMCLFLWCLGTRFSPISPQGESLHYLQKQTPKLAPIWKTHPNPVQRNPRLPGLPNCGWVSQWQCFVWQNKE